MLRRAAEDTGHLLAEGVGAPVGTEVGEHRIGKHIRVWTGHFRDKAAVKGDNQRLAGGTGPWKSVGVSI